MQGLMQRWPLRVSSLLDHAGREHAEREVVTRTVEGPLHRTSWAELRSRARRCASALSRLGVGAGDRVGTLAWNTHRHLELWYGIAGIGAVTHTVNPRLFPEQIAWIIDHAEDRYVCVDLPFVPLLEGLRGRCPRVRGTIVMTDREHMPATSLPNALCYEELLAAGDPDFAWVPGDEEAACGLCYTSGTTGNPKGVLYSHRSNVIHTWIVNSGDVFGLRSRDVVLPVVPMYHANAWGLAFAAPMAGAKLVLPGPRLDGASLHELLEGERVTFSAAVPTVWLTLLQHLEETGARLSHLERVVIGGSACPRALLERFERRFGVEVVHAWGMTEMNPIGTIGTLKAGAELLPEEERMRLRLKQGRVPYGVEMRIVDDAGRELPRDGRAFGHLEVRGPCVARAYLDEEADLLDAQGWFDTGDVSTIDGLGTMQITDRAKDVIKSGGEWISSIELENLAMGHPGVAEAAVIGVPHPRWDERPLLVVVRQPGSQVGREDLLEFLADKVARWWLPDEVVFVPEIPHTATGKIQKTALRERFGAIGGGRPGPV